MLATTTDWHSGDSWHELLAESFAGLETRPPDRLRTHGRMRARMFGELGIFHLQGSPQEVVRTAGTARTRESDLLKLSLQVKGVGRVEQSNRGADIRAGDFALYDTRCPYTLDFPGAWDTLVMTLPRQLLGIPEKELQNLVVHSIPATEGIGNVLATFLNTAARSAEDIEDATALRIRDAGVALVSGALTALRPESTVTGTTVFDTAKLMVRQHIADPDLSPEMISRLCNVSVRTLQRAFREQGLTLTSFIRQVRLDGVRHDLQQPELADRTIAEIGAVWGIHDSAWLSRAFRAEYEVTPTDLRRERLQGRHDRPWKSRAE